ncbi:MAG TPA: hypothetical protein VD866_00670 [Urbifossiella sp.]|nr:hypothetical protein [Urbifossiella sp.]
MEVVMIGVAGVVVVVLVFLLGVRASTAEFEDRFPPISDDEFVARCTPGTSRHVALTVRRIVAEHLAVEYDRVHPSMRWIEDLGAD